MHVHFDEKNPNFMSDLLKLPDRLNLTACLLTPFANRKVVAEAAKHHPAKIILRRKFDEPEDVASDRMRPVYLEEIARRFPKIIVLGTHCGNPEYEWAAEIARWNPNVFFDLSGSTLTKMQAPLGDFQRIFWWSNTQWQSPEWKVKPADSDPSAFIKIVFESDAGLGRNRIGREAIPRNVRCVRCSGAHAQNDHGRNAGQNTRALPWSLRFMRIRSGITSGFPATETCVSCEAAKESDTLQPSRVQTRQKSLIHLGRSFFF
jgi:Amidohydrolase